MATSCYTAGDICLLPEITQIEYGQLGWDVGRWYRRALTQVTLKECAVPQPVSEVQVSTLGLFRVRVNDVQLQLNHDASRKVMLMLALSENHSWPRETLAGIIWPDASRSKSLANLRQTLLNLKKSLQPICGDESPLQADAKAVSLVNCAIHLDTDELLNQITQHQRIDAVAQLATQATDGYSADLKSGSDLFLEWLETAQGNFSDQLKQTLQDAIESSDSTNLKLHYANLLSSLDPCNELACRTKMRAHHGNGEKAKALACYAALWMKLEEIFDVEPSSETQELAVAIKIDDTQSKDVELGARVVLPDDAGKEGQGAPGNMGNDSPPGQPDTPDSIVPRVAVIPFVGRGVSEDKKIIGEALADDLISVLSKCNTISVISRLSSSVFSGLTGTQKTIDMLRVQYLMSGSFRLLGDKILLDVEFCCAETGSILWEKRFSGKYDEFLQGDHPFITDALHGMGISVMANELRKTSFQPLDRLEDSTLLISAIALMHRLTKESFQKSKALFQSLIERNPKNALPYAYLSMWYALRVVQGWSDNSGQDSEIAYTLSNKALDLDPFLGLAHTLHGLVNTTLRKDLDLGESSYTTALEYNRSDSLAWLFRGTLHAFRGDGEKAVSETTKAMAISPFDPNRYLYYSLGGTAAMIAENYEDAIDLSYKSLQLNREHISTLRVLSVCLWKTGKYSEARKCTGDLMTLHPDYTVSAWLRDTAFVEPLAADIASVLVEAGIPR